VSSNARENKHFPSIVLWIHGCDDVIVTHTRPTDQGVNHMLECLDGPNGCEGEVELRMPLSGTGKPFPRCDHHWDLRLDRQEQINNRYPAQPPSDFDPMYAGERWDED
jgi:hypothetical protein